MAVTDEQYYNENEVYTVAVPKENEALKQHIAFNYPQWKLVDYDSLPDAADMLMNEQADCFLLGTSKALKYDNRRDFKSVPLTKTMEACFAVRTGNGPLLSILNKTLKTMPSDMLTSTLAIYDSTADKVTFSDFIKDNLPVVFATSGLFTFSIIGVVLVLLRKARKAEASAKLAADDTQKLNDRLETALKKAEEASLAKTHFLNNMSHDIRTPINAIIGFTALAATHMDQTDLVMDYLTKINTSSQHLLSLINDVLDMSRIESGVVKIEEKEVSIPDILHDLKTIIQGNIQAKQQDLYIEWNRNV